VVAGAIAMTARRQQSALWIGLLIVLGVGAVAYLRWRRPAVRTTVVTRTAIEQHVVASGRVRVPTRVQVAAQTAGLVLAVGAVEGQRVSTGDLLVLLDGGAERAAVAQADAAVSQARARVDQLRRVGAIVATQALRQTETNLERATTDLERTRLLVERNAVPAHELDNARRAADIARAQKSAAEAQQAAAAPMGADSRIALTALLQAQAQLAAANVRLAQTRIVAPQAGQVLTRSVEPGDVVTASRMLLVLAADADVQLVFQADERNLAWLAVGQVARASADAYPQAVFAATVSYIAPSIDPERGSVEVRLAVPTPPSHLKPDMTVSIDLTVASKADALTVPSEAIRGAATHAPHVFTVEAGRVVRRDVQLGIRGEGAVEIVGGLTEGADVIVPDGRRLAPGARIRPERE
jgi:HlyD family secretion protein